MRSWVAFHRTARIGVIADLRNNDLARPVRPAVFVPYSTQLWMSAEIPVRSRIAPESILNSIRRQIAAVNPDQQTFSMIADLENGSGTSQNGQ